MKKILLIVGMILCIAVIGSVFAIAVDSAQSNATVTADTYIYLGFDGTSTNSITLEANDKTPFKIYLTVDKNTAASGTLTITFADQSPKTLDNVVYNVYSSMTMIDEGEDATVLTNNVTRNDEAKTITITNITDNTEIVVGLLLNTNDSEAINNCGGTMTLHFAAASAE